MRVIVIDDGSPKDEQNLAREACQHFSESSGISVVFDVNEHNLGRPKTRNRLLDKSQAPFLSWIDAGDIWYPTKVEAQFDHVSRLTNAGEDIDRIWITCRYDWDQKGRRLRTLPQKADGNQLTALFEGMDLRAYLWTLLGTRKAFMMAGRFDERLPRLQDLDYFIHFVRAGGRIITAPGRAPLCRYFKSDIGRSAGDVHASYKIILTKHNPVIQTYAPSMISKLHYKADRLAARFAFSNRDWFAGCAYIFRTVFWNPRHSSRVIKNITFKAIRGAKKK